MKTATIETLRMWLVYENERAVRVASAAINPSRELWLPRSLIDRLTKNPKSAEPMSYQPIEFTLPEWKINQENLWEFVKD